MQREAQAWKIMVKLTAALEEIIPLIRITTVTRTGLITVEAIATTVKNLISMAGLKSRKEDPRVIKI